MAISIVSEGVYEQMKQNFANLFGNMNKKIIEKFTLLWISNFLSYIS